jgi:hypothetical protein
MVCHGYASNANADNLIHIYAFSRVNGALDPLPYAPGEWRFRRPVIHQIVDATLNVGVMRKLLGPGSLMQTLHKLDQQGIDAVASELGIQIPKPVRIESTSRPSPVAGLIFYGSLRNL